MIQRRARLLLAALCSLLLVSCALHSLWLPAIARFLVVSDPLQPADAIVVLAGNGQQRIAGGAELFQAGYARWFIVTNMPLRVPGLRSDYADLAKVEAVWLGVPESAILRAPGTAITTYDEAVLVRQLAEERVFQSLLVLSDPYHTRRASWSFRDALRGSGIAVSVHPIRQSWYQPDAWWTSQDSLRETWTEYLKLVLYIVGYR